MTREPGGSTAAACGCCQAWASLFATSPRICPPSTQAQLLVPRVEHASNMHVYMARPALLQVRGFLFPFIVAIRDI